MTRSTEMFRQFLKEYVQTLSPNKAKEVEQRFEHVKNDFEFVINLKEEDFPTKDISKIYDEQNPTMVEQFFKYLAKIQDNSIK